MSQEIQLPNLQPVCLDPPGFVRCHPPLQKSSRARDQKWGTGWNWDCESYRFSFRDTRNGPQLPTADRSKRPLRNSTGQSPFYQPQLIIKGFKRKGGLTSNVRSGNGPRGRGVQHCCVHLRELQREVLDLSLPASVRKAFFAETSPPSRKTQTSLTGIQGPPNQKVKTPR